uniref:tRNA pseudouridine synthase Pus10 n=1 Tax=Scophthalmus maximus TaxID=52904 RepID=A0A8D3E0X1_SCOMX
VMLPLKEKDKPIVQKLLSAGCCARCILRFCCIRVQATYRRPQQSHDAAAPETSGENNQSHDAAAAAPAVTEAPQEPPSKRAKLEPSGTNAASEGGDGNAAAAPRVCVVCLGILQELCDPTQAVKVLCVSVCLCVMAHYSTFMCLLMFLGLTVTRLPLREKGLVLDKDDIIPLKEAFKWIMQGLVSKELGGAVSALEVGVEFTHKETDADCHFLATVCPDCFKPAKNKQSVFTRMAVVKALEKISDVKFLRHFPCPPTQPSSCCSPQGVQCLHLSVFVAGRYNKFCRSLPQTPWLIDGERRMESSVEELIAAPVLSTFRAEGFNFSSSGREDVDVRTLGNGRPFAMELLNPHRSRLSRMEMKQLQQTINESSDKIRVRDLQIVTRDAMSRMKEGEEEKTKSYTALVWTRRPIQREDISFIGDIKELTLDQKTPLRVLHRRALAVRQRVVHSMNVHFLDPHHFHLRLKTQAGTYIKEFVHGDFGRTKPNLCELLRTDADILELDVESVDVDWPPAIPE